MHGNLRTGEPDLGRRGRLDRSKTIVFLPISPIEEHGPQLPIGTDFLAACDMARLAAQILEDGDRSLSYVMHPGIPLGCAAITADFPGTLSIGGKAMMQVIADSCVSLARNYFRFVIISNHHYEPAHVKAIVTAIDRVMHRYPIKVADPLSAAAYSEQSGTTETDLDLSQESHADFEETSFIMFRHPELLRDLYRELPPVRINLAAKYLTGAHTFRKMGATRGYAGSPAEATPEYGKSYFESHARLLAESAIRLLGGEKLPQMSLKMRAMLKLVMLS